MKKTLIYFLLLLIISSCTGINHGNFNKRKYLNLKLKSSQTAGTEEKQNDANIDLTATNINQEVEITLKNEIKYTSTHACKSLVVELNNTVTKTTANINELDKQVNFIQKDNLENKETNQRTKKFNKPIKAHLKQFHKNKNGSTTNNLLLSRLLIALGTIAVVLSFFKIGANTKHRLLNSTSPSAILLLIAIVVTLLGFAGIIYLFYLAIQSIALLFIFLIFFPVSLVLIPIIIAIPIVLLILLIILSIMLFTYAIANKNELP